MEAQPLLEVGVGVPIEQGGLGIPLPDRFVLDGEEQALTRDAVSGYNAIIARLASERGLALVDVRTIVDAIHDGSLITPKAYGVITNRLLEAVNARYGSRLPPIRTSDLPGVPLISSP